MTESRYNIIYNGSLIDGHGFEDVRERLVKAFSLSPEKAEALLKCDRAIVRKGLDEAAARRFGTALRQAGLDVALAPFIPASVPGEAAGKPVPAQEKPPEAPAPETPDLRFLPGKQLDFEFHGNGSEYFKIWIVNLILSILSMGIYSAWAKVRRKQYFYGNTRLQGSSFEYLADPLLILKGRMVVGGVFFVYSIISQWFPIAGAVMSLLFMLVLPWLMVRSLAFNARNSAYKNIRFGFSGSLKEAFKVYVLWPVLALLTLGVLSPYAYFRQRKFIIENSSYGTTRFTFTATHREYYGLFIRAGLTIVAGVGLAVLAGLAMPFLSGIIGLVFYLYLFAYLSVNTTNLLYNFTRLSAHRFKADMKVPAYLGLVVTNTLGTAVTLGIFYPWAQVRAIRYKLDHLTLVAKGDPDNFIAQTQEQVSALGDEAGDFFDLDLGL